jgi:hypothetical protein
MSIGDTIATLHPPYGSLYRGVAASPRGAEFQWFSGGSNPVEMMPVYLFYGTSAILYVDWFFRMPSNYYIGHGVDAIVEVFDYTSSAGSRWEAAWRRLENTDDWDVSHTYDFNGVQIVGSGVGGRRRSGTISFTGGSDMDNVQGGDNVVFRVRRNHAHADDNHTGSLYLARIHLVEA